MQAGSGNLLAGRYRLDEKLGAGGFGVVYRGTQLPLGRAVAVKLLSPTGAASTERFEQEAALAQRLDHPNTVRIIDFGFGEEGSPFIVWEYLRGQTLEALIERGPLAAAVARRIATQVLKSLMEAHALGIVHRDIKPANLFITSHPGEPYFVKVLDFGIAKDMFATSTSEGATPQPAASPAFTPVDHTTGSGPTRASQIVGTPRYMAPEQARGQRVGPETDLYALGLVIAEMLAGRKVFDHASGLELLIAQGSEEPTPIASDVARGPLGKVVLRATEKQRQARYATAAEMLAELEAIVLPELEIPAAPTEGRALVASREAFAPTRPMVAPTLGGTHADGKTQSDLPRSRTTWVVLASAIGVLCLAGIGISYFVFEHAPSRTVKSSARESRTADPEEPPTSATNGKLPPMPKVDWAHRAVPKYDEGTLKRRAESAGYAIKESRTIDTGPGNTAVMLTVTRPPCGGVIFYYQFARQSDADMVFDAQEKNGHGRFVHAGSRAILAATVRAENPGGDPACADPLAAALTE